MRLSLGQILIPSSLLVSLANAVSTTLHVCSSCDYTNITSALNALPNTTETWTVAIAPGNYKEKIILTRSNVILKPSSSKGKEKIPMLLF
ncbi:hypothetical protein G6F36_015237 [Rhizopus arrhizus]|nr:hypothetical protein G6F36_015237 [Rhizopus arrhizus]